MSSKIARKALPALGAAALGVVLAASAAADVVSGADAQELAARPIPLGVSGSSQTFLLIKGLLYCYTGTLGALVQDGTGNQYVLSNNHVLAKENENLAYGDPVANVAIIQPGLLDEGSCSTSSGDASHAVADLSSFVQILFGKGRNKPLNQVDAAIAAVRPGAVDAAGSILGIGTIQGAIGATIDQPVQKTGRTTGHTFGTVRAVGVTIDVSYDSGTARFTNQIRIRKPCDDSGFSDAGDSGSLIVTAPETGDPDAVALLFAGGGSDTFANPIADVLSATGTEIVVGADGVEDAGAMLADHQAIASSCATSSGGSGGGPGGGRPGGGPRGLSTALEAAARHSAEIFGLPDVVGHGVGADAAGEAVIEIYVARRTRHAGTALPAEIDGVPVRVLRTGPIHAF